MEKKLYFNDLYDYYQDLFTEKQKSYFESYYFDDLSLSEIAENDGVSRNAVHHQLKIVEEKLIEYEQKLKLYEKRQKVVDLLSRLQDEQLKNEILELV